MEGSCQWILMGICAVQLPHKWPQKNNTFWDDKDDTKNNDVIVERFHNYVIGKKNTVNEYEVKQTVKLIPIILV